MSTHCSKALAKLRELIGDAHGAQAEAARRLGIPPDRVSRLLSEERGPSLSLAVKIRDEYGIDPGLWDEPSEQGAA